MNTPRRRLGSMGPLMRAMVGTAGVQVVVAFLSLISGPLQARGLGPDGRGELAVVLILGQVCQFLIDVGTLGYIIKERAHGAAPSKLLGSVRPILLISSCCWLAAAVPIGLLASGGRHELAAMVAAQLFCAPIFAIWQSASAVALGEQRWAVTASMRLIYAGVPVVGLTILYSLDRVTLTTACLCYFTAIVIATSFAIPIWLSARPLTRDRAVTRAAFKFGLPASAATLLTLGNVRADALIVAAALSYHAAGIYVVGATVASLPQMVSGGVSQALARRLSLGGLGAVAAQSTRILLGIVAVIAVGLAVVSPFVIPWVFGDQFRQSSAIAAVLLGGTVISAGSNVLSLATSVAGHPTVTTWAQLTGVVAMVPSMIALGRLYGSVGAAAGSDVGYLITFVILAAHASKRSGVAFLAYIVPRTGDASALRRQFSAQGT